MIFSVGSFIKEKKGKHDLSHDMETSKNETIKSLYALLNYANPLTFSISWTSAKLLYSGVQNR